MSGFTPYAWPAMTPEALELYRRYFPPVPSVPAPAPPARLGNGVDCPHCEHGTRGETWRCTVCNRVISFDGEM